ncbi:MAG: lysylphosphatidylglycerol synthase transmembrane domain-containing protein [Pseudomonadota bacterium]
MRPLIQHRKRLLQAIQIITFLAIAVWLLLSVDWNEAVGLLASADWRWLAAAAAALTLQTILSALRWRMTAGRLGITLSVPQAVQEYYLSLIVNQSLPGGVLGDAGRAVRARGQAGLMAAGQSVLFERLAGQIGLVAVLVGGLCAALVYPVDGSSARALVSGILWGFGIALIVATCAAIVFLWHKDSSSRVRRLLFPLYTCIFASEVRRPQMMLSLGTAICNVAAFGFCAAALGVHFGLITLAVLVPLILFAMLLPLSISGWGPREGVAAALFPIFGATAGQGLATSITFGLVFLVSVLPGLVLAWLRPNASVAGEHDDTKTGEPKCQSA